MTGRQYGTVAVACIAAFVVAVVALHILDPGLSPMNEYMSVYGRGDFGWLLRTGAILLGVGTIAIALGLRETLAPGGRVTLGWFLMLIAGIALIAGGVFVTDPTGTTEYTVSGAIHDLAGLVVVLSLVAAAWLLRGAFAHDAHYRATAGLELWLAALLSLAVVVLFALPPGGPIGLMQRIFYGVVVIWLLVLATNIRGTPDEGDS